MLKQRFDARKIIKVGLLVAVPAIIAYGVYKVRVILVPFGLAVVIAYFLNPFVDKLERRNVPRGWAIALVYLFVLAVLGGIITIGIPGLIRELNSFSQTIPKIARELQSLIDEAEARYSRFALPDSVRHVFDDRIKLVEGELMKMVAALAQGVIGVFSHFFSLIIAPIFAFYLLADSGQLKKGFLNLMPTRLRTDFQALSVEINEIFSKYISGHLTVCAIVGLMTGLGYTLIGLPYAFILGAFSGVADLIPYFGPFVGAVPAFLLALLTSKAMALKVILVVLMIQQIENCVITPKILGDSLGLSPLVVIIALMVGGELYGILGLLLAVPVTAVLKCLIHYLYLKLIDTEIDIK